MLGKVLAPLACLVLVATPALAQAPAQALSLQPAAARAGASTGDASRLEGGGWIAPVLAAAIVIGGVLLATGVIFDDGDDGVPASP